MLRNRVRRAERELHGDMDYLELVDGSRYYFDPAQVSMELFLENLDKGLLREPGTTKDSETPEIRQALSRATPESLARFEERYEFMTAETGVVYSEELQTVRHIDLDGSVRYFVVEGEAARKMLEDHRGKGVYHRSDKGPIEPGPGIREITAEEEAEIRKAHRQGAEEE